MTSLIGLVVPFLFALAAAVVAEGTLVQIDIELATGTPSEKLAETQLRRLLANYDLSSLILTRRIRIESRVVPHSHPVLTLSTRHLEDDERQLATFIHEQLHWYASENSDAVTSAIADLRNRYPAAPVGGELGGRDEHGTYLHLIIGLLEFDALVHFLGRDRALEVISRMDIYLWIYDKVLKDEATIRAIMTDHGLALPSP